MNNNRTIYLLMLAVVASMLTACQEDSDNSIANLPISFNNEMAEQSVTRAATGLYNYQKSMKLYGTKTKASVVSTVFPDYRLQYLNTTKTWEYEGDKDATLTGQIIKYWDPDATQYDFVAGAPYEKTTIASDGSTVTISGLKYESTTSSGSISTPYLYADKKTVVAADFGKSVMLTFHLAECRIKVAFIFKDPQSGDEGKMILSSISFKPSASYATEGSLLIDYTKSPLQYTVTPTTTTTDQLNYSNITINYPGNVTPTYANEVYYMLPLSTSAEASAWTMKVGSLIKFNTAVVPAENMKWEPGHEYIYKFQISDVHTDPTLKFIECVNTAITGWSVAESSDATLYNW